MAGARRTRTLPASQQQLWELIADPHHMPRWWPGVERMEGVEPDRFTQVFKTKRGRPVRADFRVVASEPPTTRAWEQEVAGTPFERVLSASVIEVRLGPGRPRAPRSRSPSSRSCAATRAPAASCCAARPRAKLDEALDGLARICG